MTTLPRIAITMGDPAGIGPEVSLRAALSADVRSICEPVVYGETDTLAAAADRMQIPISSVAICACGERHSEVTLGVVQPEGGRLAAEAIFCAIDHALQKRVSAVVTAPINKKALAAAGYNYAGHTELFADKTATPTYGMMLVSGNLRVVHVSTHVSLRDAIDRVRTSRVLDCIQLAHMGCRELGMELPSIAVAGLNPHAGEDGLFGHEDAAEIAPAVLSARDLGLDASGPYPPDTIFHRAAKGEFDAVVAMYHDQGHIPVKLHGFDTGVNITLGLPIIRVSVDHGTAFDIAGKGVARPDSMIQAIYTAVQMANSRGENFR